MSSHTTARFRTPSHVASLLGILALCTAACAIADTTSLTIAGTTKGTSNVPVTLEFPVTRTGDIGYEAILNYHTVNDTALAGTDYTATSGSIVIPAGTANAIIPVALLPNTSSSATRQFRMVLDSAVGIGPTPSFAAHQTFAVGSIPFYAAAADLNGDGKLDLIVTNGNDNTISVLLNTTSPGTTSPTFEPQQIFAAGITPNVVAIADINGDGKPDLIVANQGGNTVSALFNTTVTGATTLSFAPRQVFATGVLPYYVTVADVNGDGKPDLIVANGGGSSVSVLLNTTAPGAATPNFAVQQVFATSGDPYFVTTADMNGDGKPDVILTFDTGNTGAVLLNTTAPGATTLSFATPEAFAIGTSSGCITATDLNGDGKPDLAVTNWAHDTVSVILNTTTPGATTLSLTVPLAFATGSGPISVSTADLNGDGKPDLIVVNYNDNTVSVLRNTTVPGAITPSFTSQQILAAGPTPQSVTTADVNGDGKRDLIVVNAGPDMVSVLLNTTAAGGASASSFAAQQQFTDVGTNAVTAADMNGDGTSDLIVANGGNTVSVLLNTTTPGAVYPSFATVQNFGAGNGADSITTADVNGDGKRDIIVANSSDGTVSVLLNTTAAGASIPSFATQQTFSAGIEPNNVTAADLNGDGRPDIVVTDDLQHAVVVLLNTTAPGNTLLSFASQQAFFSGTNRPNSVAIADVNGDGKSDLIMATQGNDSNNISVLLNTTALGATTPSFATAQTFATGSGNPNFVTTADINGDGKSDLVATNGGNAVSVLLNTTAPGAMTLSFAAAQSFSTPNGPSSVSAADIDGDGRPDLIVSNSAFAIPSNTVSVLLNTTAPGASVPSFATQQAFATGEYPHSVVAADINGDGKSDIVVANTGNGTVSVLLNTQYQTDVSGSPATGTIVHDYIFADGFGP